jgi:hypothetical protein
MKTNLKVIFLSALFLGSCQGQSINQLDTFVIGYLSESLPGKEFEEDTLSQLIDDFNENQGLNVQLIQKVYYSEKALEEALLHDKSIDIMLLPDYLIERHQSLLSPQIVDSNNFSYLPEFEENAASVIIENLKRNYRTEDFNPKDEMSFFDLFVPYSYGQIGIAYDQDKFPIRIRRIKDLFDFFPLNQILVQSDVRSMNYLASIFTYQNELDQAFQLYNTDTINLEQYQSLVSSYLNTSDKNTALTLSTFSNEQWVESIETIPQDFIYMGPSHKIGKKLITDNNANRFEYLYDASMLYFDGFVFLNDLNKENYSLFIDQLYQDSIVNTTIRQTHKSIMTNSPLLLQLFEEAQDIDGIMQTDFTYLFDLSISQNKNVVFSYDRSSILSTLFPNKEITQVSVIKYDYINHDFILEYLELTNQSLQSEEPVAWAQILLIFLIILISSGLIIIVVLKFRHNSKKEIKTIKPYKVIKLEKRQLRKAKNK